MRFADIYGDVERITALTSTSRNTLKRGIQNVLYQYANAWAWPHYRDRGVLATVDDVTAGTVTVSNGSKTLTGASTAFTAAMVGRKLRIGSERTWYEIASYTSATSLTLAIAYQGSLTSGNTYVLYQDEYRLDADAMRCLDVIQGENQVLVRAYPYLTFDQLFADPSTLGDGILMTLLGRRPDTDTTGTVTGSAGGTTLTGSGTTWTSVEGLGRGSRIAITSNNEVYTVKSVDSDTSITIYETIGTAFSASALTIHLNNLRVQLTPPADGTNLFYFRKQRRPTPLVNDRDEPDMPLEHHGMLVDAGLGVAYTLLGHLDRAKEIENRVKEHIAQQVREIGQDSPAPELQRWPQEVFMETSPHGARLPLNYGYPDWF